MVKKLKTAIDNYYDAIFQTGYMSQEKVNQLLVLDFLVSLKTDPDYLLIVNPTEKGIVNKLYNCIVENNCLI